MTGSRLTASAPWRALAAHRDRLSAVALRELFAADPQRANSFSAETADLYLDYSRQRVTAETMRLLLQLAEARDVGGRIAALFRGDTVNVTEQRAALHVALRMPRGEALLVDGADVVAQVHEVLDRLAAFSRKMRAGVWLGHTGRPIRNVVNLGTGGSHLGPAMACRALLPLDDGPLRVRFVSNVDAADFLRVTHGMDPAETLFVVCSKTFTTPETLANARMARAWLHAALPDEQGVRRHFAAVSANLRGAAEFGVAPELVFPIWDWVGGRYSMASAAGLPVMLALGVERFAEMLSGFRAMDVHFSTTPLASNLPVLKALLAIWNNNFLGASALAVLPYADALQLLPAYLQQLMMESNGKGVDAEGRVVDFDTAPICFGEPGTNGQHSFYQLLHQGTRTVACDFIGFARAGRSCAQQHRILLANLIAQGEALAFGRSAEELAAAGVPAGLVSHQSCPGNRPSSTIMAEQLTPATLGALVALYEHSVFVQGIIWGIDSFDQWGVALGKQLAAGVLADLDAPQGREPAHDSSTNALIRWCRARALPAD